MDILKAIIFITAISGALVILIFGLMSKKPIRKLLLNAFVSLCLIAVIDLTSAFTGAYIPLNKYTVGLASVFGVPAISLYLVLKVIMI